MSNHDRKGSPSHDRDAELEGAWRLASDEQPPARLDDVIIGAAHKSTQHRDQQAQASPARVRSWNGLTRWQPLAAAAAVTGLAFVLLQSVPRDRDVAPPIQLNEQASAPTTATQTPRSPLTPEATEAKAAVSSGLAGSSEALDAPDPGLRQTAAPAPDAPAPAAALPPASTAGPEAAVSAEDTGTVRAEEFDRRKAVASEMAERSVPAAASARDASRGNAASFSPADWTHRIEAQYASGDVAGAAETLRAFRAEDPDADASLPESLRQWARTVE